LYDNNSLAPAGSTGNQTFPGVNVGGGQETIAFQFVVETAGGTSPTITWKVQGSVDDPETVVDANANWFDVGYITDASDTISQATRTATTVGAQVAWLSNPVARRYRRYRLVTSASGGTAPPAYHCNMYRIAAR
jgi:hypothetical protein